MIGFATPRPNRRIGSPTGAIIRAGISPALKQIERRTCANCRRAGPCRCPAIRFSKPRRWWSTASCTRPACPVRSSRSTPKPDLQIWRYQRQQKVVPPRPDQPLQSRRGDAGEPDLRRHARCRAGGARRAQRAAAMGNPGRRCAPRLQPHFRAAGAQGQDHRGRLRRRIRRARLRRRLRSGHRRSVCGASNTVPGPGEFGHDTWKGDSWQHGGSPTWLTGSYDPDWTRCTGPSAIPAPISTPTFAAATICSVAPCWRSIPPPAGASGIISSLPAIATIGMPPKT